MTQNNDDKINLPGIALVWDDSQIDESTGRRNSRLPPERSAKFYIVRQPCMGQQALSPNQGNTIAFNVAESAAKLSTPGKKPLPISPTVNDVKAWADEFVQATYRFTWCNDRFVNRVNTGQVPVGDNQWCSDEDKDYAEIALSAAAMQFYGRALLAVAMKMNRPVPAMERVVDDPLNRPNHAAAADEAKRLRASARALGMPGEKNKAAKTRRGKRRRSRIADTPLTHRQKQAMQYFAESKSVTDVAKRMGIKHSSASKLLRKGNDKLGIDAKAAVSHKTQSLPHDYRGQVSVDDEGNF